MVEIVKVEDPSAAEPRVQVRSALGEFAALWSGPAPVVGDRRGVELSFGRSFIWGVNIVPVEPRAHAIGPTPEGGVELWASVEQLDDGGSVGLRLGPSIVMADAEGEPPPVGATVWIESPELTLCDTNL